MHRLWIQIQSFFPSVGYVGIGINIREIGLENERERVSSSVSVFGDNGQFRERHEKVSSCHTQSHHNGHF